MGRKAADPLNRVALMNSLLCQSFLQKYDFEKKKKKKEDILKTKGGWEEEDEFTIDKLLLPWSYE